MLADQYAVTYGKVVNLSKIFLSLIFVSVACSGNIFAQQSTDTVKQGICIVGGFGVFNDTLGLFGDVYLQRATQEGGGMVALVGTSPQLLVSNQSQLNNLLIENPRGVRLHGELTVRHSLHIRSGVFDVRMGELLLLPTARLLVSPQATLLQILSDDLAFPFSQTAFSFLKATAGTASLRLEMAYTPQRRLLIHYQMSQYRSLKVPCSIPPPIRIDDYV